MNTQFASLPDPSNLAHVFQRFPHGAKPLLEYHDVVLRGESPLTPGERELIAAHVSGINATAYCYAAHSTISTAFGTDADVFKPMQVDLDSSNIPDKLKPILAYVSKLTTSPGMMTSEDAKAVYDAGWDERALYDALAVCALFNLMNRLVEGTGCTSKAEPTRENLDEPLQSYVSWGRDAGFVD